MKREAIILLNMGGPNNIDEVQVFLKNMFDDPNILTMKSVLLRKFIAKMIIFSRLKNSQAIYKQLGGKSPIVDISKKIVEKLQNQVDENVIVDFVMRYTPPFATEVIEKLKDKEIETIYLIPMYPQYSTTTTKSSLEDFREALKKAGLSATTLSAQSYIENKKYNQAVIERIKEQIADDDYADFELIFSAHGLPQKIIDAGDMYQKHIEKNVAILKKMLQEEGMHFADIHLAYQSKVGPMKWLTPSLGEMLKTIKTKKVIIYPVAFTVDNSETDYELSIEYKEVATALGIEDYRVCRCVNDHPLFVDALEEIYEQLK